jgi:pimeloyl-ACP methyl ester carboxylesterase
MIPVRAATSCTPREARSLEERCPSPGAQSQPGAGTAADPEDERGETVDAVRQNMGTDHRVRISSGVRLSYREVGSTTGRPVLYLHGTPSSRKEVDGTLSDEAATLGLRILAPDRPGYGRTPFVQYSVRDYPEHILGLLDVLEVDQVGLVGVSGGGPYACACAARLGPRVSRTALVASTAPSDLDGVRATWSKEDRQRYALAVRAPWLLRSYLALMARRLRADPRRVPELFNDLPPEDAAVVDRDDVREILATTMTEAFRQGTRGAVHDIRLDVRPWGVDLSAIEAPVDVWHGHEDTLVPVAQAEALARAIPTASSRLLHGEGHVSILVDRITEILEPFA